MDKTISPTGPVNSTRYRSGKTVVVVLTLTHGYNAVRGHGTGSGNSGVDDNDYLCQTKLNGEISARMYV